MPLKCTLTNQNNGELYVYLVTIKRLWKCKVITRQKRFHSQLFTECSTMMGQVGDLKYRKLKGQSRLKNTERILISPAAVLHLVASCPSCTRTHADLQAVPSEESSQEVLSQQRTIATYISSSSPLHPRGWQTMSLVPWHPLERPSDAKEGQAERSDGIYKSQECECPWIHDFYWVAGLRDQRDVWGKVPLPLPPWRSVAHPQS